MEMEMEMETELSSSSASANSGDKGRVCICCWCAGCSYSFYILDFDVDNNSSTTGLIEKSPAFRIDHESLRKVWVCVSDPYVYVIGAVGDVEITSEPGEVWMSRYDLRRRFPSESSTIDITPSELEEGRVTAMKHPKFRPGITASPDGSRVVVYSRYIEFSIDRDKYFENHDIDFELFDTRSQHWSPLPQFILCLPGEFQSFLIKRSNSDDWIEGLGGHLYRTCPSHRIVNRWYLQINDVKFINGNTLLVTLDVGLLFTLNLDSPEEGWKYYGDEHIPHERLDDFALFESEPLVVVTSFDVKVVRRKDKEEEFTHEIPFLFDLSQLQTPLRYPDFVVSVLKYVENKECVSCIFMLGVDERAGHGLLICDLSKLDLVPRDGNDCRPIHLGSYKYVVDKSSYYLSIQCVAPFFTAIESQKRRKLADWAYFIYIFSCTYGVERILSYWRVILKVAAMSSMPIPPILAGQIF